MPLILRCILTAEWLNCGEKKSSFEEIYNFKSHYCMQDNNTKYYRYMVNKTNLAPILKELTFTQGRALYNQQLEFKCGMGCAGGNSGATGTQKL